jgi:hypothetical protein
MAVRARCVTRGKTPAVVFPEDPERVLRMARSRRAVSIRPLTEFTWSDVEMGAGTLDGGVESRSVSLFCMLSSLMTGFEIYFYWAGARSRNRIPVADRL